MRPGLEVGWGGRTSTRRPSTREEHRARMMSQVLGEVALFHGLDGGDLEALGRQVAERRYTRGEIIFSQGDPGDGLYIVRRGHVGIRRQNLEGDELLLTVVEPEEYFGELALFDEEPRSATAVALEPCTTLFLSRAAFRSFLEQHPPAMVVCMAY